ncbi:hypothetical protein [Haloimpatiens massiliensis]|uniref:hypothetical protein n=1 Tax=Haloimpatiens massiliensis TaxID=1658110 RepID=UPI000C842838|nr:hypothetical protein [Haloimpatiens massiliensis]
MVVTRTIKTENQENPQIYTNYKEKSKKILDYLNQFQLTELSDKGAFKNTNTKSANINMISTIIFNQNLQEGRNNIFSMITINFLDNSIIEIIPYFKDSQKDYKKSTTKYYKINNNKIDFNYIEKLLAN